jgi:hypothetical protein
MQSNEDRPVNIGTPMEYAVHEIARMVVELSGSRSEIVYGPLPRTIPNAVVPTQAGRARRSAGSREPRPQKD